MKKIISIIVIFVIIGGLVFFFTRNNYIQKSISNNIIDEKILDDKDADFGTDNRILPNENKVNIDSRYLDYSKDIFEQQKEKKRVLFFHAAWCPFCMKADQEFSETRNMIPEDVVIFKTDYDSEESLKDKYGITYQHTFVYVDENGEEIVKWNGGAIDKLIDNTSI